MNVTAIVGANWGDEGKGKLTDYLAAQAKIVVRFQGGNNAGHTIINEHGKFVLHMLPSGVLDSEVLNILGPGVALNMESVGRELAMLRERGRPEPRLLISDRAQVVLPLHPLLDRLEEERLGGAQFGSTRNGIAPFYADKYLKVGIQAGELFEESTLRGRLEQLLPAKNALLTQLYGVEAVSLEEVWAVLMRQREVIRPFIADTAPVLHAAWERGDQILLEGQLGALRDPDHGIYPYCTSSSTLAGYASVGAGIPARAIQNVVAVTKAYSSCVGAGPFVTELLGGDEEKLRRLGGDAGEFGATTGRPRRVGWFDAVATRYGCRLQGATALALTNLDVLGHFDEIPVCVAYGLGAERTEHFPATVKLGAAKPVYETLPGWQAEIGAARNWDDLPENARRYVKRIEELAGVPVRWVSVGPHREQTIEL